MIDFVSNQIIKKRNIFRQNNFSNFIFFKYLTLYKLIYLLNTYIIRINVISKLKQNR